MDSDFEALRVDVTELSDKLFAAERRLAEAEARERQVEAAKFLGTLRIGHWEFDVTHGLRLTRSEQFGNVTRAFEYEHREDTVRFIFCVDRVDIRSMDDKEPIQTLLRFAKKHKMDVRDYEEGWTNCMAYAARMRQQAEAALREADAATSLVKLTNGEVQEAPEED